MVSTKALDPVEAALLAIEETLNLSSAKRDDVTPEEKRILAFFTRRLIEIAADSRVPGTTPRIDAAKARERLSNLFQSLKPEKPRSIAEIVYSEIPTTEAVELERVTNLLGGTRVLQRKLKGPLDAHEMLLAGLPGKALSTLIDNLMIQKATDVEKAIGMSLRTFQRHKDAPSKPLSQVQSGRVWKFAEILAKATTVLGSQEEAEKWLDRPALGLNQRRPIDLLATPAGVELVEDFLERLEYGVYA